MLLSPELEERLSRARLALEGAASGNIIELCRQYLAVLAEYRAELLHLPDRLGLNRRAVSSLPEGVDARAAIRAAIEQTTRGRHETEALLLSFTTVSGYEAAETFNRRGYKGHTDWEVRAGGVARFCGGVAGERMTLLEAVETASLLRREEHIDRVASARASRTTYHDVSPAVPPGDSEPSAR
ncbi:MAG TPA: hypothetical protein VK421_20120 [Pyrinomonadaceae bacterium]|nr:hypothetical protein [Pyrinomonadaceae bacterium]